MKQKQVRRSKKEVAHERGALEQVTRRNHKARSKVRTTVVSDFDFIFARGLPDAENLTGLIDTLISEFRDGPGDPADHDRLIFDPALDALTKLPIGVLDHKELPLPNALIPRSRDDLHAHCERMIVRSRRRDVIAYVVAGWPGCDADRAAIRRGDADPANRAIDFLQLHVSTLWQLSAVSTALYQAIVCGRHGTALRIVRTAKLPAGMTIEGVTRLIQRHGLLWCTNDLQMIVARGALGAKNPFGLLASTTQVEVRPERSANDLKPQLVLLRLALDLYATTAEEHDPVEPKVLGVVPADNDLALLMKRRLEQQADRSGIDLQGLRSRLDGLIEQIRRAGIHGKKEWWDLLAQPVTANELASFSGMWFSGLSHVQVAAVTILRYLQAEVWIERMVAERIPDNRRHLREHPAIPPFDRNEMGSGWVEQAKDLLFLYRREVLRDKMAPKSNDDLSGRTKNAGLPPINRALQFLAHRPARKIGDDDGGLSSLERTFYLIDLMAETRLAR